MSHPRPRQSIIETLIGAIVGAQPSFTARYGSNPKSINGGQQTGAAAHKRAARKRRNIRNHPRGI